MKVLVVGGGGREHALVWKIRQSRLNPEVLCAPGNAGIASLARCVGVAAEDVPGLVRLARQEGVDLTVVGPEAPLAAGLVDALEAEGLKAFGPRRRAAAIEGSKSFAKELMARAGVPTAGFAVYDDLAGAREHVMNRPGPWVIKADGLAAGKGVVVTSERGEALKALETMFAGLLGAAGHRVVMEDFLEGEEVSVLAFCHGQQVLPMVAAQDHKRLLEGDQGPNTGGMGAYSPPPCYTPGIHKEVVEGVLRPVLATLEEDGSPYCGVLYAGIILTAQGPKVLEFNARFGDPETQAVLMRLKTDLLETMLATVHGELEGLTLEWHPGASACVVLASGGYPGAYEKGQPISGLTDLPPGVTAFHAGTALKEGKVVTSGGRVLGITALGDDISDALATAYRGVEAVRFPGMQYRRDIGYRALKGRA